MSLDEDETDVPQVYYPREYYLLAAAGCVVLGFLGGAASVYLYPIQGNWLAGVLAIVFGLCWMFIAHLTNCLRRAHHGY